MWAVKLVFDVFPRVAWTSSGVIFFLGALNGHLHGSQSAYVSQDTLYTLQIWDEQGYIS